MDCRCDFYIRSEFSNDASFVTPEQVAKIRAKTAAQKKMYQFPELLKLTPYELALKELKATASHMASTRIGGNASAQSAFNYEGWSTGKRQEKDMWFQLEFPQVVNLAEVHFTSVQMFKPGWRPQPNTAPGPPPIIQTFPRGYTVETSTDGLNWQGRPEVKGVSGINILSFNATKVRFLRLKLSEGLPEGSDDAPWSMRQMKVFVEN